MVSNRNVYPWFVDAGADYVIHVEAAGDHRLSWPEFNAAPNAGWR